MTKFEKVVATVLCFNLILLQASLSNGQGRVRGGTPTVIDYVPFIVQIFNNGQFHCGGTLVDNQHVVTACHCTKNVPKEGLTVKAGATHLSEYGVTSLVSKIIEHPSFTMEHMDSDIAVLKLATPLTGPLVRPISISTKEVKHGDSAQIMGWGKKMDYTDNTSVQLFYADVNVFDINRCRDMYKNIMTITDNMYCAYAPGKSTCNGDSGGPMLVNGEYSGIVSFGVNCGVGNNLPYVFTKISNFISFIEQSKNM